MYQAASALNANSRWQEIISQNLASSNIPGFKKQEMSFQAVQAGMLAPTAAGALANSQPISLATANNHLNFSPGQLNTTGVNTHLALEGEGFFEVQMPNGTTAFTRDGEFKVNALGQLVTKQGYLVMGEEGPIQMDPRNSVAISVSSNGTVSQGNEVRGKLHLVAFNDPKLLTEAGGGCFVAKDPNLQPLPESGTLVHQGVLEGANTSSVLEMANLISVMRAFEANQKVIQTQDERMGRAISELGNPN